MERLSLKNNEETNNFAEVGIDARIFKLEVEESLETDPNALKVQTHLKEVMPANWNQLLESLYDVDADPKQLVKKIKKLVDDTNKSLKDAGHFSSMKTNERKQLVKEAILSDDEVQKLLVRYIAHPMFSYFDKYQDIRDKLVTGEISASDATVENELYDFMTDGLPEYFFQGYEVIRDYIGKNAQIHDVTNYHTTIMKLVDQYAGDSYLFDASYVLDDRLSRIAYAGLGNNLSETLVHAGADGSSDRLRIFKQEAGEMFDPTWTYEKADEKVDEETDEEVEVVSAPIDEEEQIQEEAEPEEEISQVEDGVDEVDEAQPDPIEEPVPDARLQTDPDFNRYLNPTDGVCETQPQDRVIDITTEAFKSREIPPKSFGDVQFYGGTFRFQKNRMNQKKLTDLTNKVKEYNMKNPTHTILIEGHVNFPSSDPAYEHAKDFVDLLSSNRACAYKNHLLDSSDLKPGLISTVGLGGLYPLYGEYDLRNMRVAAYGIDENDVYFPIFENEIDSFPVTAPEPPSPDQSLVDEDANLSPLEDKVEEGEVLDDTILKYDVVQINGQQNQDGTMSYAYDKSKLKLQPDSLPLIKRVGDYLLKYPNATIMIVGHTSIRNPDGTRRSEPVDGNVFPGLPELLVDKSTYQAQLMANTLVAQGVNPKRILVTGAGDKESYENGESKGIRCTVTVTGYNFKNN